MGGYAFSGKALPNLNGRYIVGHCTNGKIWVTADDHAHGPMSQLFDSPFIEVVTFGQDRNGEIYFAGTANVVYRLVPSGPPVAEPPALLSQTGVFSNLAPLSRGPGLIPLHGGTPLWS